MRFLYVLLISLLVVSCSSVPKVYLKNNDICGYTDSIFTINKEDMVFNSEIYQNESTEVRSWSSDKYLTKLKNR